MPKLQRLKLNPLKQFSISRQGMKNYKKEDTTTYKVNDTGVVKLHRQKYFRMYPHLQGIFESTISGHVLRMRMRMHQTHQTGRSNKKALGVTRHTKHTKGE
ncbi:unnamed protein product [Dovyalis caffra]|uniref:Uncharacterized protein n=1 Tax=Dovyalis caffra TaxID=77055 RepID=A0AAV1RX85_9ROSI|nr:unnamed protein product [Dovyalis caffra]